MFVICSNTNFPSDYNILCPRTQRDKALTAILVIYLTCSQYHEDNAFRPTPGVNRLSVAALRLNPDRSRPATPNPRSFAPTDLIAIFPTFPQSCLFCLCHFLDTRRTEWRQAERFLGW